MKQSHVSGSRAPVTDEPPPGTPPTDAHPTTGDVVLYECSSAEPAFELGSFASPPSLRFSSYVEAVEIMSEVAARYHIDGWLTRDGSSFRSIVRHRVF